MEPPEGVTWVAGLSMIDPTGPLDVSNFGPGTRLTNVLASSYEAQPGVILLGYSEVQLEPLGGAARLEDSPVRPLLDDEAREGLPTPVWAARVEEDGVKPMEPASIKATLTCDRIRRLGWKLLEPAESPEPRAHHALSYDESTGLITLVGGAGFRDTWTFDGTRWTRLGDFETERGYVAAAYDASRRVTVAFGGGPECGDETNELVGADWVRKDFEVHPSARCGAAMTYDSDRQRLLLYGGERMDVRYGDLWAYDGTGWHEEPVTGPFPGPRTHVSLVYDAQRHALVLFGGNGDEVTSSVWTYDGTAWSEEIHEVAPIRRSKHAMAFDRARQKSVLFGGWYGSSEFDDTWELGPEGWREVPVKGPVIREAHAMTYDARRKRVILFGGCDTRRGGCDLLNDTWEFGPRD